MTFVGETEHVEEVEVIVDFMMNQRTRVVVRVEALAATQTRAQIASIHFSFRSAYPGPNHI